MPIFNLNMSAILCGNHYQTWEKCRQPLTKISKNEYHGFTIHFESCTHIKIESPLSCGQSSTWICWSDITKILQNDYYSFTIQDRDFTTKAKYHYIWVNLQHGHVDNHLSNHLGCQPVSKISQMTIMAPPFILKDVPK